MAMSGAQFGPKAKFRFSGRTTGGRAGSRNRVDNFQCHRR